MPSIIVHGGAGAALEPERRKAAAEGCLRAARIGRQVLQAGGSALDAAEAACAALEDDPLFNAGTGSVLTADGTVEMDAGIMEGDALRTGAVAAVTGIRNPIRLARWVMERSPHALLAGEGARRFALEQGMAPYPPALLVTERALARWKRQFDGNSDDEGEDDAPIPGTVGAVVRDASGRLAAATSTGGTSGKLPGRVGDSPLLGAGFYADRLAGAASATGHGEAILRVLLSKVVCDRMQAGAPASVAAREAITVLDRVDGEAGIICIDPLGHVGWAHNAPEMSWAAIEKDGSEITHLDGA